MSVILITGSSTGIGMATALYLSKKGIALCSMRNPDGSGELRKAAAANGSSIEVIPLDVSDEQSVNAQWRRSWNVKDESRPC